MGKQTVYSHFSGKEGLFLEAVRRARDPGTEPAAASATTGLATRGEVTDPEAALADAVDEVLEKVLSPTIAALHRLTIAELPHHRQLQRMWRDDQGGFVEQDDIADYLRRCHRGGTLSVATRSWRPGSWSCSPSPRPASPSCTGPRCWRPSTGDGSPGAAPP